MLVTSLSRDGQVVVTHFDLFVTRLSHACYNLVATSTLGDLQGCDKVVTTLQDCHNHCHRL